MPDDPLAFIKNCIRQRHIFWTYHVNMRLGRRELSRDLILNTVDSYEIIERYPDDKYLPSYLIRASEGDLVFHVQIATDIVGDNIRIVTAYLPDPAKWSADWRNRKKPR